MNDLDVVAIGARTPVGPTAAISAASVRARISRARPFPFITLSGEPIVVAADAELAPELEGRYRVLPLITSALDEAFASLPAEPLPQIRVLLALPESRPGFSDQDVAWVAAAVRDHTGSWRSPTAVQVAGRGHAGAIQAIGQVLSAGPQAAETLSMVVGGDSYLHPETFLWLEGDQRLAQPGTRGGFMPGEGAGCICVASSRIRKRLELRCHALVRSAATAQERLLRDSEDGTLGVGLSLAVTDAASAGGLALPDHAADAAYIDINGERYRSEEWGFTALRVPGAFRSLNYIAPADCWGDVGAAFAPLAAVLAVRSFARCYARGPRAVVLAGSESGLRGALWLEAASSDA